jgi:hypothetical protein
MTVEDTKKLLAIIKVAYPLAYRDLDRESAWATVQLWYNAFKQIPYSTMESAFEKYLRHGKFAPTVAEMTEELTALQCDLIAEAALCSAKNDKRGVKQYLDAAYDIIMGEKLLEGKA